MKKLLFLGACLVALASAQPSWAQNSEPEVVLVKVREITGGELQLTVCRGSGKSATTVVSRRDAIAAGNGTEAVQQVILQLSKEGYTLKTSYGGGWNYEIINTLVFIKNQ